MVFVTEQQYSESQIVFRESVPSGQGLSSTKRLNNAGIITQILFHFPPGCNGLVEVKLMKNGYLFYPLQGVLALDNATPVYYVNADYYANEPLTVEVKNKDSVNPHSPSVAVTIRYKKQWWREREE